MRDPLKGRAREDGRLAGALGFQYAPVDRAGLVLKLAQVGQAGVAGQGQVAGAVDEDLRLLPGAVKALRRINDAGLFAILITNQRWLSAWDADSDSYYATQLKLSHLLGMGGAHLDASYTCPHAANNCGCRKPLPGMLLRAAKDFSLDLRFSFVVGDSVTDVQAGLAVGATTFLISSVLPNDADQQAHFVVRDIAEAIERILEAV